MTFRKRGVVYIYSRVVRAIGHDVTKVLWEWHTVPLYVKNKESQNKMKYLRYEPSARPCWIILVLA